MHYCVFGLLLPDVSFSTEVADWQICPRYSFANRSKYWFAGFGFDSGPNLQPRIHQIRKNNKEGSPINKWWISNVASRTCNLKPFCLVGFGSTTQRSVGHKWCFIFYHRKKIRGRKFICLLSPSNKVRFSQLNSISINEWNECFFPAPTTQEAVRKLAIMEIQDGLVSIETSIFLAVIPSWWVYIPENKRLDTQNDGIVWKRWTHFNMAIFDIYVRFLGCTLPATNSKFTTWKWMGKEDDSFP